ncbi:RICIN domain-containing protein [Streptomyces sp. NRRL S-1896]|nr:RICIN domain-containing protein [Streptomyces sp. NRRL S-1896]
MARRSDKAVSIYGKKTDNGVEIIQWPFEDGDHQKWNLEATSGGYYVVRAVYRGKAPSVLSESKDNGAKIFQWDYAAGGSGHQEWRLVQRDDGYFAVQNRNSGLYLSVNAEDTANGIPLVQWTGGDGNHQQSARWSPARLASSRFLSEDHSSSTGFSLGA